MTMIDPVRAKLKLIGGAAVVFTGGVLVATALDWPADSQAATFLQASPAQEDVRPVGELSQAFISIAEAVTPAVVSIETERTAAPQPQRGQRPQQRQPSIPDELREWLPFGMPEGHPNVPRTGSGSGFIISTDGHIITNNHVIEGADKITVILQDNRHMTARVVGRDPLTDVAVIRIEADGLPAVRLGRSEDTRIGEWVLAIGNPLSLGTTVTSGIVSAKGRNLNNLLASTSGSPWAIEDFLQTDAPINPGNSGGPLVNLRGEVVGVNTAIASPTGFYSGYGFAVPIDLARRVADDLMRYGKVRRPALGVSVTDVSPEDAEVYRLERIEGVVAQDFPEESPARRAGVTHGDVIVAVDGSRIQRVGQFQRLVASKRPGDEVTLDVIRYGERQRIRVRLSEAPAMAMDAAPERRRETVSAETQRLGVGVSPVTAELAQRFGIQGTDGLVVTQVERGSLAARRGIREGTRILAVDGQTVRDGTGFRRLIERKRPGEVMSLRVVHPTGENAILNIRLPD
jgi:serine protease Do